MKIISAVFVLLLIGCGAATAQWRKGDERVADTADRKSVNDFGVQLLMVEDPRGFIEEWSKPETPVIKPLTEVKRGVLIGAFVFFAGCKPDAQGVCNSAVDYTVYKPDGSVYAERKEQPLWKEAPPPGRNIQLSRAILGLRLEAKDPAGEYKVKAKVNDFNANVTLELETTFKLK
jgi:hypothetical protein